MGTNLASVDLGAGRTAKAVSAGTGHTCALLDDATVKCWGYNKYGQLGLGDITYRGDNANEMGTNLASVDLGAGRTAVAVSAGSYHTCALLDDATVKCWGYNGYGNLGLGDKFNRGDDVDEMGTNLASVDLGAGRTAVAISAGLFHSCALLDDATVKCWGQNSDGRLGLGDTDHRGDDADEMGTNLASVDLGAGRTAKAVSAGIYHTCALLDDATLKCWGRNARGQLGLGDISSRGDDADEMGTNLASVDLGTGRTAKAVSAGYDFTCALLDDATVKCWGFNVDGQLGLGDTARRGDDANEMGTNLTWVDLGAGRTAVNVSAGWSHACALLDDATVKCWGHNTDGELGLGDMSSRGDDANGPCLSHTHSLSLFLSLVFSRSFSLSLSPSLSLPPAPHAPPPRLSCRPHVTSPLLLLSACRDGDEPRLG
ncbi:regulator of chromosome condensation 1/beta-lactamase-inhibitor protein II [Baffinella frigidus]|nr:regulator of chromosome condensation 1/beta-lactamase-inhibitor protein II [Cryptophyta sp. CCMP2293]